jgi:hypothetical protein
MYDLPSVSAFVHLHHASAEYPVSSTWFAAINAGNYNTFLGLTLRNTMKHCPSSNATIKGHLKQLNQGPRSTKPKPPPIVKLLCILSTPDKPPTEEPSVYPSSEPTKFPPTNELYITDSHLPSSTPTTPGDSQSGHAAATNTS